jgi:Tol biopolymer transport system component
VRGLRQFVLSPDGRKLAYTRELPVAGKPLLVVAQLDGSRPHVVAHAVGKTLSWSADGKTLFAYGLLPRCWMCAVSVATGATRPIPLDYRNLQGVPAISPSGARLAFCDLKGPAGERVFTVSGTFLRNIAGFCGNEAFWSPDETRLIFYDTDELFVFDFATRTIQSFQHAGPSDLRVLGWAVAGRR